ncbi:hypothetical protein HHI36_017659 [Cryptolaemus montrouzieri]|uniref:Uncharacterized protein n=1 Tax=Cryptolaemus montrouzieri TaxID=559131 RepID=A0ABD2NNN6_9CUCU
MTWNSVYKQTDVNEAYNQFLKTLEMGKVFKYKKIKRNSKKFDWITADIRQKCRIKRRMYFQKRRGEIDAETCSRFVKLLNRQITQAKKAANMSYIENSSQKSRLVWDVIGETQGTNKRARKGESDEQVLTGVNIHYINACKPKSTNTKFEPTSI